MSLIRPIARKRETIYITLNTHKCRACWKCVEVCPVGVIGKVNLPFHKHACIRQSDYCTGCLECVGVCLQQAITPN